MMAGADQRERTAGLSNAEVAAWTARSRARCGLGPKVIDPVVLVRIITLAFTGLDGPNTTTPRGAAAPRRQTYPAGQQEGHHDPSP
jgi:hypothetical protein